MRNSDTPFRDYYVWHFKDWFVSGARARLTLPQRAIFLDLLGFCYTEGGIAPDTQVLLRRLGLGPEYAAELEAALAEFEVHPDDASRLMHPRTLIEAGRLAAARERQSKGGKARSAQFPGNVVPKPPSEVVVPPKQPRQLDDDERPLEAQKNN